jgi:uncharacterized protein (DUF1330 family)
MPSQALAWARAAGTSPTSAASTRIAPTRLRIAALAHVHPASSIRPAEAPHRPGPDSPAVGSRTLRPSRRCPPPSMGVPRVHHIRADWALISPFSWGGLLVTLGQHQQVAGPIVAKSCGKEPAAGPAASVLVGDWWPKGVTVIELPSIFDARRWHDAPTYQEPKQHRQRAATCHAILVDGLPG